MLFEPGKDLGQASAKPDSDSNGQRSELGKSSNGTRGDTAAHLNVCGSGL